MLVTIDFETYWDKDYTLSSKSMNTSEYIRDDRFQILVMAIKINDQPTQCLFEINKIRDLLTAIDWTNADLLCHNTAFDGFILSTHFGVHPKMYYDTLSMARAVVGHHHKLDLNSLGEHLALGSKKEHDVLFSTKGKRDLTNEELSTMCVYATQDVDLCYSIFSHLLPTYPQDELDLIDQTIRMFCEPVLQIDLPLVEEVLLEEVGGKAAALMASNSTGDILRSNIKFAEALEQLGVCVQMKQSRTTRFQTFAFAKNDEGFQNLLAHRDPRVRLLCEARLKLKSSIGETRANRFLEAGKDGATLPVMLNYYGAHTGRWSAGNKMNLQNLPRGGKLRSSILAPEGHVIVVVDSAQIEARMLAWLADYTNLVQAFAEGRDVYREMAAKIFKVSESAVDKTQRFVGKVCILGLGYGMGATKLCATLSSGGMGLKVDLSHDTCTNIVAMYRSNAYQITYLWEIMNSILAHMSTGSIGTHKCLKYSKETLKLPNGLSLMYPELRGWVHKDTYTGLITIKDAMYKSRNSDKTRIYGGLLTENVVQALARIVIGEQMLEISKYYKVVSMTHDEIIIVAPKAEAELAYNTLLNIMKTPPAWATGLPLNAEGGYARNYSK